MTKQLIYSDKEKEQSFQLFIEGLLPQLQSLINLYNKLNIGKVTQQIFAKLAFNESSVRHALAKDYYSKQKGLKMSLESIAQSIELPEGANELFERYNTIDEMISKAVNESYRIIGKTNVMNHFVLKKDTLEISEIAVQKTIERNYQLYAETERELELYNGLKEFESALEKYRVLLKKFNLSNGIWRSPTSSDFVGFNSEMFNYPNTEYKLVVDPQFVKNKA